MKSRLTTASLVLGLSAFGVGGAYAGASTLGIVHGQAHAQHGNALGHGKKGHKHHSNTLCAQSKKHGRKHHGKSGKSGKTLCGKKHGKHAPSVPSVDSSRSSAVAQYGTRPGKGCGDRNHVHTGPPGNPSNTQCPPQSKHD
jgi:hypothetical protein